MNTSMSIEQSGTSEIKKEQFDLREFLLILFVAGLGFFIDVYDIAIFSIVRVSSFISLGVSSTQMLPTGIFILNMQMLGMIVGGFLWGILGDKKGRKFTLFGSILLYSIATFLNGFVNSIPAYAALRFLAGIGLAGEVGAAIIIVAEVTPPKYRAYATGAVRALGILGAVLACLIGDRLPWRMVYLTAGIAGILLLLARISIKETPLFLQILNNKEVKRGSIKLLLTNSKRLRRLAGCGFAALPFWFVPGILTSFAPEICHHTGAGAIVVTVAAVKLCSSGGEAFGEVSSGIFSQLTHSRKLPMLIFTIAGIISTFILLSSPVQYYALLCIPVGFFIGYTSVVLTSTAEQFGTNLRSTSTTLVSNFFRASAIPITLMFSWLIPLFGTMHSAMIIGGLCFALALVSILFMEETFAKKLNFVEN
jgi:MFS transporter, putative metabolite:H+ symporter